MAICLFTKPEVTLITKHTQIQNLHYIISQSRTCILVGVAFAVQIAGASFPTGLVPPGSSNLHSLLGCPFVDPVLPWYHQRASLPLDRNHNLVSTVVMVRSNM